MNIIEDKQTARKSTNGAIKFNMGILARLKVKAF
jgi:hypothetical protein